MAPSESSSAARCGRAEIVARARRRRGGRGGALLLVLAATLTAGLLGDRRAEALGIADSPWGAIFADTFESGECAAWSATWNPPGGPDADLDSFGDELAATTYCVLPPGMVPDATDCDDADELVYPGAPEVCNGIDDDCDGAVDEDLADTNPACPGINLGEIAGDGTATPILRNGTTEARYYVLVRDVGTCFHDAVGIRVQLQSPVGIDYDLHLRCFDCPASNPAKSSTVRGLVGHTDVVELASFENCDGDDSFFALVEIRWFAGISCSQWSLTIEGDQQDAVDRTCGGDTLAAPHPSIAVSR